MRCLVVAVAILATIVAAFVAGWMWYGWWGLLGVAVGGFLLLWLVAELGPRVLDRIQGEMVRVAVHSVQFADEPDAVPAMLRQFEGWIRDFNEESEADGYDIDVSEFLTHNEERPDLAKYFVEITAGPPEGKPDAKWSPHGIGLKPVGSNDPSGFELYDVQRFDADSGEFKPFLKYAFEDITGEHRLRLHVGLDPEVRHYQFEYAFNIPIDVTIEIPAPDWSETPMRRFTLGVLKRLEQYRPMNSLRLDWLEIGDDDLDSIGAYTELQFLGLDDTRITNDGLRKLTPLQNLEAITLDRTGIDDHAIEHLEELAGLKRLFVRQTKISKSAIQQMREAKPDLKIHH